MNFTRIRLEIAQPVATVTLDRPDVHNAFDETLIAELTSAFQELGEEPSVRVVVLAGAGKSFCAGADLEYMGRVARYSREENVADARTIERMMAAIAECPSATIARVHGAAIGGGVGLVAACDISIASEDARFGLSEVRIGLVPAVIGPYVLQKIGMGACRALFVSGERIDAAEARRIGLLNLVVPPAELDAAIDRQIELIFQSGPKAVAAAKRLLREIEGKAPAEAAETTIACIADLRAGSEGQEGIRAFLEKRTPAFATKNTSSSP